MRARRSTEWERAPEVVEAPKLTARPGDVVVAAGVGMVSRSDLHVFHHWSPTALSWNWTLPLTLGQEVGDRAAEPSRESRGSGGATPSSYPTGVALSRPFHAFGLSAERGG